MCRSRGCLRKGRATLSVYPVSGCTPVVEGIGDLADVVGCEVAQHAVFHVAEVAGVDEEDFAGAVA